MVGVEFEFLGNELEQLLFNDQHVLAGRDSGSVGDAENMRVDRNRGVSKGNVQDYVRGFTADPRQGLQRDAIFGHLGIVLVNQDLAGCDDVFGLGIK